jgi:hypothetical protein
MNSFVILCRHGVPVTSPRMRGTGFECTGTEYVIDGGTAATA